MENANLLFLKGVLLTLNYLSCKNDYVNQKISLIKLV